MSYGPHSVFIVSAACAATYSSALDLQRSWGTVGISVPSSTTFDIVINGSDSLDGTYKRLYHEPNVSNSSAALTILSSVSNAIVPFKDLAVRFIKIEQTTAPAGVANTYKIFCADN